MTQDRTPGGHVQREGDWGQGAGDQSNQQNRSASERAAAALAASAQAEREGPVGGRAGDRVYFTPDTVTRTVENERGDRENPNTWSRTTTYQSSSGATLTQFESGPYMRDADTYSITLRDSRGHELNDQVARTVLRELQASWPAIRLPFTEDRHEFNNGSPLSRAHSERSHAPGRNLDRGF